jgi:CRISPR system Cascade subunit CasB
MTETNIHPFITYLQSLAEGQDRGALASLRRGLGRPPGAAPEMYRYVEPYLPQKRSASQETAYYLVAALFAFHPKSISDGNMGTHMAKARTEGGEEALERRFTALLNTHSDDLPDYLRQAVSFLKSKDIPINWDQLFWDLQNWDREDYMVQKHWASTFWGRPQLSEEPSSS